MSNTDQDTALVYCRENVTDGGLHLRAEFVKDADLVEDADFVKNGDLVKSADFIENAATYTGC